MIRRELIRADGTVVQLDGPLSMDAIQRLIGASSIDVVMLPDRVHAMIVDDLGHPRGLPRNEAATALYLERCRPGTTHFIVGDVVVVPDSDFGP